MSELPDSDSTQGAPHPRDTPVLYGHAAAEAEFLSAIAHDRLHSGWLISGPQGIGKATLAYRIAAFLLGDRGGGMFGPPDSLDVAADDPDLRLIRAGAHPRLFVLKRGPNDKGDGWKSQITVDEARKLKGFFQLSAADGGRRVVIVDPADELNPNAANAILKLLEEPPPLVTLLLLAHQPARLLPTIRSRCRVLRLAPLGPEDLSAALTQAGAEPDAGLSVLAAGSVGTAIRLSLAGGAALYAEIVRLLETLPRLDRAAAGRLADSCGGRGAADRFALFLDLADLFLARLARAGIMGTPATEGAPGEAALLARLSPDDRAARHWAATQQELQGRARHGQAVNLDPAGLILDMLLRIEEAARIAAPA